MSRYRIGAVVHLTAPPHTLGQVVPWFDWRRSTDGTSVRPPRYYLPIYWIDGRLGYVAPQRVTPVKRR